METNTEWQISNQLLWRIEGDKERKVLHRSIGALIFFSKSNQMHVGNAVLLSSDLLLTAAQNIYDRDSACEYSGHKFYVCAKGQAEHYYEIDQWRFPHSFKQSAQLQFNYAIAKLKHPVLFDAYMPLSISCQTCLSKQNQQMLFLYGFPWAFENFKYLDQEKKKIQLYQYGNAKTRKIKYLNTSSFKIGYDIAALPGQTGCPLIRGWVQSIIAIHIGRDASQESNYGRIVDSSLIEDVIRWQKQLSRQHINIQEKHSCEHIKSTFKAMNYPQTSLNMISSQLQSFDLSNYKNLRRLNLYNNQLKEIQLVNCPHLFHVMLTRNELHSIDTSSNIHLAELYLVGNKIQQIDVSYNTALRILYIDDNLIKSIDLRKNENLRCLSLMQNFLVQLDLTSNKQLVYLEIAQNKFTSIDLSCNKKLDYLSAQQNKLKKIDLSQQPQLKELFLYQNDLTQIDLTNNSRLQFIVLSNNKLQKIILMVPKEIKIKPKEDSIDTEYAYFDNQQSKSCAVVMNYDEKVVSKTRVIEFSQYWEKRYQKKDVNQFNCQYHFVVM